MSSNKIVVVGVDIGTESTKVVVLEDGHDPEIVRNELGGHTTPTLISFDSNNAKLRKVGAAANPNARHNTVLHLNRLLPGERDDAGVDALAPFYQFGFIPEDSGSPGSSGSIVTNLDYNYKDGSSSASKSSFSSTALLAMLFGNVHKNVLATLHRRQQAVLAGTATATDEDASTITNPTDNTTVKFVYSVACPPDMSPEARQCVLDAVYAGVAPHDAILVERGGTYKASYERKFPDRVVSDKKQTILIVDMGHAETTVIVLGSHHDDKDEGNSHAPPCTLQLLSSVRSKSLGAGNIDVRLWEHVQSTEPDARFVKKHSKAGQRLLAGTAELKHQLSQLPKASVMVENVGGEDGESDLNLAASRRLLADVCQKIEIPKLVALLEKALQAAGISSTSAAGSERRQIDTIELVGGGCRVPFVKDTIEKILKEITGTTISYSYSMDDASVALGAALVSAGYVKHSSVEEASTAFKSILARRSFATTLELTDIQVALRREELTMTTLDEKMQERASTLNLLETRILELRSAQRGSAHGYLLPDELFAYLDEVENWLFLGPADEASNADVVGKWDEIKKRTSELIQPYQRAVDDERKAKEAEMEAEARQAELQRAFDDQIAHEAVDHDNRRLSKKRRMEIVMKNNKEGGDFFRSGNYGKY
jgi:hypothetical protein